MKAFVIAMDNEADCVVGNLADASETREFGFRVVRGRIGGDETMVVVSGIGKAAAAAAAQFAIQCGADVLINAGVAGGLDPAMEVADMYEADSAVQYDFDLSAVNGTMVGTLDERPTPYIPLSTTGLYPAKSIGTGDRFSDSDEDNDLLLNVLSCAVRDMECAAIAQVCERAGVRCVAFKCITDVRGRGSMTGQYVDNLARCLARLKAEVPAMFSHV